MILLYPDTSTALKTISQSINDQVFSLTYKEYATHVYRNQHKILILITATLIHYIQHSNNSGDIVRVFTCLSSPTSSSSLSEEEKFSLSALKSQINSNNWTDFTVLCDTITSGNTNIDNKTNTTTTTTTTTNYVIPSSLFSQVMVLCQLLLDFLDTRGDSIWYY